MPRNRSELMRTIQGKLKLLASLSDDVDSLIAVTRQEEQHLRSALSNLFPGAPRGRPGRPPSRSSGGAKKRGRAFKFTDDQASAFRKRVEDGATATALAKELKVSLPTMYNTLKRVGWKGKRGTALGQHEGDVAFVRCATTALAGTGQCEIVTLRAGDTPVASAIVLRHQDRAFYFKLGVDERFSKFSPGVQLTLDLTRHLCADPAIARVDSTANPDHPMINPIWRGRLAIGDVLIPLRRRDPLVALIHAALGLRNGLLEPARGLGETAPFHDAGEDAHGVEVVHCSNLRMMMSKDA